jgi:hypothetical protein
VSGNSCLSRPGWRFLVEAGGLFEYSYRIYPYR